MGASTTGCFNIGIGHATMSNCALTGDNNIAIGNATSAKITTGVHNIAIGACSACGMTTGCFNINIGKCAGLGVNTGEQTINIGKAANKTNSESGCISGASMFMAITDTSDCRAKTSISTSDLGLDFINAIRPVKYKYKVPRDLMKDDDGNIIVGSGDSEGVRKSKVFQYGFLAQEIEKVVYDDLGMEYNDFDGINDAETDEGKTAGTKSEMEADPDNVWWPGEDDYDPGHSSGIYQKTKSVKYMQFIAPMVKAIQELSTANIALMKRVKALE